MATDQLRRLLRATVATLLVLVILAGIWLRLCGFTDRSAWYDEVATFLHLSGRTESQFIANSAGHALSVGSLMATYQSPQRPSPQALVDIVTAVAADEPQSGWLYFAVAGMLSNGSDDAWDVRRVSRLSSTVALILLGWLAWRLFDLDVALAAVAIAAVSPLELRYAHEARPYALCAMLLLASALAVERASRVRSTPAWCLYAILVAAAISAHPVALLAVPGLLALGSRGATTDVVVSGRLRVGGAHLATTAALVAWMPWAFVCFDAYPKVLQLTSWANESIAFIDLVRGWVGVLTSLFFRPRGAGGLLPLDWPSVTSAVVAAILATAALSMVIAGLVALIRHNDRRLKLFIMLAVVVPWLTIATVDIAFGGRRSTVARYLISSWFAIQLAVAYWLARAGGARQLRTSVLMLSIALACLTAFATQRVTGWWDTDLDRFADVRQAADYVGSVPTATVVTDMAPLHVMEFARYLPANVALRIGQDAPLALRADDWACVIVVSPTPLLLRQARQAAEAHGYRLESWRANEFGLQLWRSISVSGAVLPVAMQTKRASSDAHSQQLVVDPLATKKCTDYHGQQVSESPAPVADVVRIRRKA